MCSIFCMAERVPSSFAGYFVSFLAESQFGYHKPDVEQLSDAGRAANVRALSTALALMTSIPWILCIFTYSSMHFTYNGDVQKTARRVAQTKQIAYKIVDPEDADEGDAEKCLLAKAKKVLE
mmetsp:Transcript_5473/g.10734  ORF Transcript_5473/g.10734 Transcript_5473/m.10734 type:complete len:122 (+) Transcript_5473:1276-1641(+)